MGFSPMQVDDMSLYQLAAAAAGYMRGQGGDDAPPVMTDAAFDRMVEATE